MPLTMACCRFDSIYSRSLRELNPYTALIADMHIDGIDAIITPLETNARTLITTKYRRAPPPRWERVGTKPPARLQLLREDPCVVKDSAFRAKYADIFEKQTPMLSWTWRIYGIHYVKVYIRTNKPLNVLVRLRLSFSVSLMD